QLLHGPRAADRGGRLGHGPLARGAVRVPLAQRPERHRVLPCAAASRGGGAAAEDGAGAESATRGRRFLVLPLGALGVVYGDIGTSPLYALRECFHGPHAVDVTRANVLGVLSLIFWALIVVISIKYLTFVMRADNQGEGGILSLVALTS